MVTFDCKKIFVFSGGLSRPCGRNKPHGWGTEFPAVPGKDRKGPNPVGFGPSLLLIMSVA